MRNTIVKEYLESLKEDQELDYIFPILLESMDFQIVATPKNSKGQPQYGKDVIAIGKDENGEKCKWYFELKGNAAKNIDNTTFLEPDGVRESILEAKVFPYKDASIPGFDDLPAKVCFVHNGIVNANTQPLFDAFISKEFPKGGFERWGIEVLTKKFTSFLFDECLLADDESYRLLKKTLVLLDAPTYDFIDYKQLLDLQFKKGENLKFSQKREIAKLFATIKLIVILIEKYSRDYDNLTPAKYCIDYAVLQSWAFILRKKWENKPSIIEKFYPLITFQYTVYANYLNKTQHIAIAFRGLYTFNSPSTEQVCYPIRCYDYLSTLLYFFFLAESISKTSKDLYKKQFEVIKNLIENNSGFDSVLLDTDSIVLCYLCAFVLRDHNEDVQWFGNYLSRVVQNLVLRYRQKKMLPELYGNKKALARSIIQKSDDYEASSSLFIVTLLEIVSFLNMDLLYTLLKQLIDESKVDLQVSYPIEEINIEQLLFEKRLNQELSIESSIKIPTTMDEFKHLFRKKCNRMAFRTSKVNLGFLIPLAHMFYKTDVFPWEVNFGFWEEVDHK